MRRLITIGTGSGLSQKGKGGPCHLVEVDNNVILMDCGEGASGYLRDLNLLLSVDWIIITHLHADHISGLMMFIQDSLIECRPNPIDIFLPEEGIKPLNIFLNSIYLNPDDLMQESLYVRLKPLITGKVIVNDKVKVKAWQSDHFINDLEIGRPQRPAFGITVESENDRLVYTGDVSTIGCFASELKLNCTLLCDAMHIRWGKILETAKTNQVKRVIFTHVDPKYDADLTQFCDCKPDVFEAFDGSEFQW